MNAPTSLAGLRSTPTSSLEAEQERRCNPGPKGACSPSVLKMLVRRYRDAKKRGHVGLRPALGFARHAQSASHLLERLIDVFGRALSLLHRGPESTTLGFVRQENSKCICYSTMGECVHQFVVASKDAEKGKNMTSKIKTVVLAVALAACLPALAQATTKEWTYFQQPGSLASDSRETARPGGAPFARAQLFREEDGTYLFRLQGVAVDLCYNGKNPAKVENEKAVLTITPQPKFVNCPRIRLIINQDGSGGVVQVELGKPASGKWATDEDHEYRLTPL